jgi:hypothetical protein
VCDADATGLLTGIREFTDVRRGRDGGVSGVVGGARRPLAVDARVSMNLWGFQPRVLEVLADAFSRFVAGLPDPDEELQLPDVVGDAVERDRLVVRLLPCGAGWFGLTHAEDRPTVEERLAERGPPRTSPSPA